MTEAAPPEIFDAPPKRDSIPRWIIPLALAVLLVAASVAIVITANRQGGVDAPPVPGAFVPGSVLGDSYAAFDVREVQGSTVTVSSLTASEDDLAQVQFSESARIELLDHATFEDIELGQWISVVGIPNEVFNFSIVLMVIMPQFEPVSGGLAVTPGGFFGHEAGRGLSKDDILRPLIGGEVIAIGDAVVTLAGPDGDITLEIFAGAPLLVLGDATIADISSGDRLAVHATAAGDPGNAGAVLISRPLKDPTLLGAEGLGVGGTTEDAGGED